ncbi:hypothetical protein T265_00207, partial [Opisthorchis viverrini]
CSMIAINICWGCRTNCVVTTLLMEVMTIQRLSEMGCQRQQKSGVVFGATGRCWMNPSQTVRRSMAKTKHFQLRVRKFAKKLPILRV